MITIITLLLILSVTLQSSFQCLTPSFDKTEVNVNSEKYVISGCISPDSFQVNQRVYTIDASYQNILSLNKGAVQNITDIISIYFTNSSIEIIREAAFLNLPSLNKIDLSNNRIDWISENSFTNLPSLTEVYLRNNLISDLPRRSFDNLPKLKNVYLSSNHLESFDQNWFSDTPSLATLVLNNNRLRRIPRATFINLPSVNSIHLNFNEIDHIDKDAFKGLNNLKFLFLSYNRLKSFELNLRSPCILNTLSISFNNLTYFSDRMLDMIAPNLKIMTIMGNPWQCGCYSKLITWGTRKNIQIFYECTHQELVCVYPKSKKMECIERSDDDFYNKVWDDFKNVVGCKYTALGTFVDVIFKL